MSLNLTQKGFKKVDLYLLKSNLSLRNQAYKIGSISWILGSLGSRDILDKWSYSLCLGSFPLIWLGRRDVNLIIGGSIPIILPLLRCISLKFSKASSSKYRDKSATLKEEKLHTLWANWSCMHCWLSSLGPHKDRQPYALVWLAFRGQTLFFFSETELDHRGWRWLASYACWLELDKRHWIV